MDNFTLKNNKLLICGKTKSGKSCLLKYLLIHNKNHFKKIFCICPTEKINSFYKDFVDENNIFDEYDEKWLDKFIIKMTDINSNKKEEDKQNVLLIFDDCCSDADFQHSKAMKRLFTRGRHLNIAVIITSQYIYQISPVMRNNCDYVLVSQMNHQGLNLLIEEYILGSISKNEFIKMYYRLTNDFGFLVINNNSVKDNNDLNLIYGSIRCPDEYLN